MFCELTSANRTGNNAIRTGHHFVSGKIGMFRSKNYLGSHVGTRGLIKDLNNEGWTLQDNDRERILEAWDWIKSNNPLFATRSYNGECIDLAEMWDDNTGVPVANVGPELYFGKMDHVIMLPNDQVGPACGTEGNRHDSLAIGIDDAGDIVKYSNPNLLGLLFPTLYVYGRGYYSVPREKRSFSARNSSGGMYSRLTLKTYAKFRLLSIDRRFGMNSKYIFMLFDWIQKQVIYGFNLRRISRSGSKQSMTAADVVEKSKCHRGLRLS